MHVQYAANECWSGAIAILVRAAVAALAGKVNNGNKTFRHFLDSDWVCKHGANFITQNYCRNWKGAPNDAIPAFVKVATSMPLDLDGGTLADHVMFGQHKPKKKRVIAGLRFVRGTDRDVGHWTAVVRCVSRWRIVVNGLRCWGGRGIRNAAGPINV